MVVVVWRRAGVGCLVGGGDKGRGEAADGRCYWESGVMGGEAECWV